MNVEPTSLTAHFRAVFATVSAPSQLLGRVLHTAFDQLRIHTDQGEYTAFALERDEASRPVTGDWVVLDPERSLVVQVLPRATEFVRQAAGKAVARQTLAANMDLVFLVMAMDSDFSARRMERYLTLAHASRARPVVLLTKAADCADAATAVGQVERVARRAPVHAIDVIAGVAADVPARYLSPGVTAALLGSSGVGKSTLVNHLLGASRTRTAAIRESDQKGRHTTTARELFWLENGAALIDTPGLRELQLWADAEDVQAAFDDVAQFAEACRFRDCKHAGEPGCAVAEALATGELGAERFSSYQSLLAEVDAHARRRARGQDKRRGRQFSRLARDIQRRKYGKP
jgi:ribosome biogenesis GTPase / thiamine phosphate phosphatase